MDPYQVQDSIIRKPPVIAKLCSVHGTRRSNRQLCPILQKTRAVSVGAIHELIVFDHKEEDGKVNDACYIGFAEILSGGIIKVGDQVIINGDSLGKVYGFDETHMPNHQNILIEVPSPASTGLELELGFGDAVIFK